MIEEDTTHEEKRLAMDLIMKKAIEFGKEVEILTVDNHADAAFFKLK